MLKQLCMLHCYVRLTLNHEYWEPIRNLATYSVSPADSSLSPKAVAALLQETIAALLSMP